MIYSKGIIRPGALFIYRKKGTRTAIGYMDLDADMTQHKAYNVTIECINVVKFVHTLSNTLQTSGSLRNKGRQLYQEINQVTIAIPNDVGTVLCTGGAKKGLQETVSDDKSNRGPVALSSVSRISHLANPPRHAYTLIDRPTFEGIIPFSFFTQVCRASPIPCPQHLSLSLGDLFQSYEQPTGRSPDKPRRKRYCYQHNT